MPELSGAVTVPEVELLRIGSWAAVRGDGTITAADLDAMVAAAADPEVDAAPLRIGHDDARFDGTPALGWLTNVRRIGDRLVADLEGVPALMAPRLRDAWRRRSIEAVSNLTTASGKTYQRALTGLALLGIAAPAVKGLADVAALYAASGLPAAGDLIILTETEVPRMDLTELRQLLGLAEGATVDDVRAALAALIPTGAAQVPAPPPATPGATTTAAAATVAIDRGTLADLQRLAVTGSQAATQLAAAERDTMLTEAVRDGRISPFQRTQFAKLIEVDPAGVRTLLTADPAAGGIAKNTFPVTEIGHAFGADDLFGDDYDLLMASRGLTSTKER